jgi:hypothetical protein
MQTPSPKESEEQKKILKNLIITDAEAFYHFPKKFLSTFCKDRQFILEVLIINGLVFQYLPKKFQEDEELFLVAFTSNFSTQKILKNFLFLTELSKNKNLFEKLLNTDGNLLEYASDEIKNKETLVMIAFHNQHDSIQFASEFILDNENFMLKIIEIHPKAFLRCSERLQNTKSVVLKAMEKDGSLLLYVPRELQTDTDIVFTAVKNYPFSINYVDPKLFNNFDFVTGAINFNPKYYNHATLKMRQLKEITYPAVIKNVHLLKYVPPKYSKDRELFLICTSISGSCLEFASKELKADREIVINAVSNDGKSYFEASDDLKKDIEIINIAMKSCDQVFQSLPIEIQNNPEIAIENIIIFPNNILYTNLRLQKQFVMELIPRQPLVGIYCKEFHHDKEILLQMIKYNSNHEIIQTEIYLKDKEISWAKKKYFKFIRDIQCFNFKFNFI